MTKILNLVKNMQQALTPKISILLLCLGGTIYLQLMHLDELKNRSVNKTIEQISTNLEMEKARLEVLQSLPSFGFKNIFANWVFLDFIQYFGDKKLRSQAGYSLSPEFFRIIIKNDPRFVRAYLFLFSSTSIYAGLPEATDALMEKGTAEILSTGGPRESYYIWRYKALNELLYLGDNQAAQQSYEMAVEWANQYSDPESRNVAKISRNAAEFYASNPDTALAQISAWISVFNSAVEDDIREIAVKKIRNLGAQVTINAQGQLEINLPPEIKNQ